MIDNTSINYQQFFTKLLEAAPWPIIIIDGKLSIYFYNQRCARLLEATEPLQGLSLERFIHERVILQFVRESIQSGQVCNDEFTMDHSGRAWRVSVTPLEYEKRKKGTKETTEARDAEEEPMADDPDD